MSHPTQPRRSAADTASMTPRVVVRFRDGLKLSERDDIGKEIEALHLGPWSKLVAQFPGLKLSPVFTAGAGLQDLTRRAMEIDPTYTPPDFGAFFYMDAPPQTELPAVLKSLLTWDGVREAYIDRAGPDPAVTAVNDPRSANQIYLDAAPDGIDAEYAWNFAGGDGAGISVIDLEQGWTLDHEDLVAHGATLVHGTLLDSSRAHGTAVLGEICAFDNTVGCVGIVPHVSSVGVVSYYGSTRVKAIEAAIAKLHYGDVLLLEAQVWLNGSNLLGPIEAYDAEYEMIRLATALGIIVVEAGGNGTNNGSAPALNMDTYTTLSGRAILNRDPANPDFRDSGAIIVTAATSAAPHFKLAYGPHGRRIDCYAWAENIDTLSSDAGGATAAYRSNFSGTSGASPIVTGAALAVQGRSEALLGSRFSPQQMRAILSDAATGTPPAAAETALMGVMPNLRAIFDNVFNSAPDVYVRDYVGDLGEPHSGVISASPDIILRPTAVADPQAAYGAGSGTENSNTLGAKAEAGQDNYIYVRVLNQGGSPAVNVVATVYWSHVATLVTPDLWTLVGSATIPSVPVGEQLTVAPAIVWPKAAIPAPGHYCFVGLVGNAQDPPPGPAEFLDFDKFRRFIQENNNVSWRNFNVENNEPDTADPTVPAGFKALKFMAPGAPDRARTMQLEIQARLPQKAKLQLEVPLAFFEMLHSGYRPGKVAIDAKRGVALLPLNATGRTLLAEVRFPARSRTGLRLLAQIPKELRKATYHITARQLFEKEEVGRVTWMLAGEKR